ncbi:S26 family signal peptidase [Allopusillimonas ginsengisoli]|uniref:S26 family signal peptidase n=1 Tax=Allopusillimonas ginsengisoli TaxID=453575 RepID=UPI0039C281ED
MMIRLMASPLLSEAKTRTAYFFRKPTTPPLVVLLCLLMVVTLQAVGPLLKQHYRIGIDAQSYRCLPFVAYLLKMGGVDSRLPDDSRIELKKGMLVSFVPANNAMGLPELDGHRIVKIVAGLPGDVLEVKQDRVYINGTDWGGLKLLPSLGKAPGALDRTEVVPEGKVLLMGTLENSYDGRYYGFMDQSAINAQAFALF